MPALPATIGEQVTVCGHLHRLDRPVAGWGTEGRDTSVAWALLTSRVVAGGYSPDAVFNVALPQTRVFGLFAAAARPRHIRPDEAGYGPRGQGTH
jgi:hypothetical protein